MSKETSCTIVEHLAENPWKRDGEKNRKSTNEVIIEARQISKIFSGKPDKIAVRRMSFSIQRGKITAIIGESGSGKSTLLRMLYGLHTLDTGEINVNGTRLPDPAEVLIPGHPDMRLVSQAFDDLIIYASVWDNVAGQLSNDDLAGKKRKTKQVLKRLRIEDLKDQRVVDLSGGEKQRVAIATALVSRPAVLLMDEPFNQVDAAFRDELQEDIREVVTATGVTVVMVSHDPAEVLSLADQLMVLKIGKLVAKGTPRALFEASTDAYTAKLLARANILKPEEAQHFGVNTVKHIGVHRYDVEVIPAVKSKNSKHFRIKSVNFRGTHSEVLVEKEALKLRAIVPRETPLSPGDEVDVQLSSHWELAK